MSADPLRRPRGRRRLAARAAIVPALALLASMGAVPAQADEPAPELRLSLPDQLTVFGNGTSVYSDLGVRLENDVDAGPFELWLQRGPNATGEARYDEGVVATEVSEDGDPIATIDDPTLDPRQPLSGLSGLVTLSFAKVPGTGTKGKVADITSGTSCLGGDGAARVSPDAPARSPFPAYCFGGNPFALGTVQGIPNGWDTPLLDPYGRHRIPKGTWTVTATVDPDVASALSIADPVQEMTLTVKKGGNGGGLGGLQNHPSDGARADGSAGEVSLTPNHAPSKKSEVDTPPDGYPLPDLEALPAFGFEVAPNGNFLRFSATVWNGGDTPIVVDGFRRQGEDVMDGYQYYFDEDGNQLPDYTSVGEFEWDPRPTHQHWHFRSFARYVMLPHDEPLPPGDPEDEHEKSKKEAFCLANTDSIDLTGEGAAWNVDNSDLSTACGDYGSRSIREVLAAGWGDTYSQFRAGQAFSLKGQPNGCYDVWVEGNPVLETGHRTLFEADTDNNLAKRVVKIGGKPGKRTVKVAPVGIVDPGTGGSFSCPS